MKLTLKLLAPYFAVALFWCAFHNAWLAILTYHVQILYWSRKQRPSLRISIQSGSLWILLPAAAAGPILYFLLPVITGSELTPWLTRYRLTEASLLTMIPYFGLVHPILEQVHWAPLRQRTPVAHAAFAGYHLLVLSSLLSAPWLILCFVVLAATSCAWRHLVQRTGGLLAAILSHVLADLGIVIVACLRS